MPSKKQTTKNRLSRVKVGKLRKETEHLTAEARRKVKGGSMVTSYQIAGSANASGTIDPKPKP